ncbi:CHAT domain-containing protein [Nocardia tenerifensis]|uniref:CHAT domain-containing protein n=1 Tax=Nocardia tenerifensis TaxID=228006 RepID=A0A318JNR4_9NOCA|nr:CHAT domain-containing protein [Nocardia tenerifensis]PXX53411.1 CHAT domain-containing protein [Nocardia tenerifensis]
MTGEQRGVSQELADTLAHRNIVPFEDHFSTYELWYTLTTQPWHLPRVLPSWWSTRRLFADHRTRTGTGGTAQRLGDHLVDVHRVLLRDSMRDVAARVFTTALLFGVGYLLDIPMVQIGLVAVAGLFLSAERAFLRAMLAAKLLPALIVAVAMVIDWKTWWLLVPMLYLQHYWMFLHKSALPTGLVTPAPHAGSVMPRWRRLVRPRQWSDVSIAVESAFSRDPAKSLEFIEFAGPQHNSVQAAMFAAEAVANVRVGRPERALLALRQAETLTGNTSRTTAVVHLARGEIYLATHRQEEALQAFTAALRHARGRAADAVATHARHQIVAVRTARGDFDAAMDELMAIRARAIRRADTAELNWTELILLGMMLEHGNLDGFRRSLLYPLDADNGRLSLSWTSDDHVSGHLFRAHAELERPDGDPAEAEYQVQQALIRLADHPNTALTVSAYYEWARAGHRMGTPLDEVLARVLTAIRESERLRFRLPASRWRNDWAGSIELVYALALDTAARAGDVVAVAEVLELIRSQPVPEHRREDDSDNRSSLLTIALGSSGAGGETDPADGSGIGAAALGADLIEPPARLRIDGSSWIGPAEFAAIDIETCLETFSPAPTWYLAGAIVAGELWTSLRDPSGTWSFQRTPLHGATEHALKQLLDAVPDIRTLATPRDYDAIGRIEVLEPVSRLLLPPPLRLGLLEASGHLTLVIGFTGLLTAVPFAALPVQDQTTDPRSMDPLRVIERADLITPPPWPVVAQSACLTTDSAPRVAQVPVLLAVVAPDPRPTGRIKHARPPHAAEQVLADDVGSAALGRALREIGCGAPGVAYFVCHGDPGATGRPATAGIQLADGPLAAGDLLSSREIGFRYPMPDRLVVSACESLGADIGTLRSGASPDGRLGLRTNPEWIGFPIGCSMAGARHIVATRYCVPDSAETTDFDHELVEAMAASGSPWTVVGDRQRAALHATRCGQPVRPLIWQSYCYYGFGVGTLTREGVPCAAERQADLVR